MAILHSLFLPLLIIISWFYGVFIWIKNGLYNIGLFKSISFNTPIISIGNITTGGTGKTPMVIYLSKLLERSGWKPGIVSRGYGRDSKGIIMVHNGKKLLTNVHMAGDEPYLMGKILNTIPIIVSEDRIGGIHELLDNSLVDIIILDDAFQHRKVKRDLDVVMISAYDKLSDYHLLPWGNLREPLNNIKRAQYVIYTKTKQFQNPFSHKIIKPFLNTVPIASIMHPVLMKIDATGYHKVLSIDEPVFIFCGIGNSNSFIQTVEELGLIIAGGKIFKDHQEYNSKVLRDLSIQIQSSNCKTILTTEKDVVKIPERFMNKFIFYIIKIDLTFKNDSVIPNLIQSIFSTST